MLEQQPPPQPTDRPRTTTRYMTKYERARILGTRALQIRCARPACTAAMPFCHFFSILCSRTSMRCTGATQVNSVLQAVQAATTCICACKW